MIPPNAWFTEEEDLMNILTTAIRNNHHWKRHALRAVMAYNTVMGVIVAAGVIDPLMNHWR